MHLKTLIFLESFIFLTIIFLHIRSFCLLGHKKKNENYNVRRIRRQIHPPPPLPRRPLHPVVPVSSCLGAGFMVRPMPGFVVSGTGTI
jgi:hypothetical protein